MNCDRKANITIYNEDCFKVLEETNLCASMAIADPPYCSGGASMSAKQRPTNQKYCKSGKYVNAGVFFDSLDQRSYLKWTRLWMEHVYKNLADGGYFFCFTDWRQLPTITDAFQMAGFLWLGSAVWDKKNARPNKGRLTQRAEFIVYGTKGKPLSDKIITGLHAESPPMGDARKHVTEKPVGLMKHLLSMLPGGEHTVIDPFMGLSPVGVACTEMGYSYVGIEKEAAIYNAAKERLFKL